MPTIYGDRERCYSCFRPKSSCMCQYISSIDTDTKFIILMHPKEFKKVKNNTGFFTHLSLKNSELFIGIDFSNHKKINEIIATHNSYILFPSQDAIDMSKKNPALSNKKDKPLAIFLIDSTWLCTKKIFTLSNNLNRLQHLSFTTTRVSQYEIKEQPQSNYLSTIESTLVVLELLDKWHIENIKDREFDNFLTPFLKMVEYQKEAIEKSNVNSLRFRKKVL